MNKEIVIEVTHYSDRLFSFKTTRSNTFRFKNGEFAMIGLDVEPRPILRAYSIVSTNYEDYLEFLSIKVPDGPLTSRLQHLKVGDEVIVNPKTTGSLCIDYVHAKPNLIMLSTGTGLAPFMSIVNDIETYNKFKNVYLFHTVRTKNELAYNSRLAILQNMFKFRYISTVTREDFDRPGRFWDYIEPTLERTFRKDLDVVMACGSPEMNKECREYFSELDWQEGNTGENGDFMLERAFAG
jgi:ferredoxin--NADP+ reductase